MLGGELLPREKAWVSVFDSSVQDGDAVWEELRVYDGKIFQLDPHLDRLFTSMPHFPRKRADRRVEEIVALIPRRRVMQASLQKAGYEIKHVRKLLYGRLKVYIIKAGP